MAAVASKLARVVVTAGDGRSCGVGGRGSGGGGRGGSDGEDVG